jgi:hypothetical protein
MAVGLIDGIRVEVLKDIGLKDRIKDKGHKGQHFVCPLRKGQ